MHRYHGVGAVAVRIALGMVAVSGVGATGADVAVALEPSPRLGDGPPNGTGCLAVAWYDSVAGVGSIAILSTSPPWEFQAPPLAVGQDAIARYAGGRIYVVSREAGTVAVVCRDTWTILHEHALGGDSQPQDIAVVSPSRAYVTRSAATHLLQLDLLTGAAEEVVDLDLLTGAGDILHVRMMAIHEGRLFVQFCRQDPDIGDPVAYLGVVDLATEQLIDVDPATPGVQAIALQGTAPRFKMQIVPETRTLFVSATGDFFDEGGVEMVDLDSLQSVGMAVREADGHVGADLGAFVLVTPERGYLTFSTDLLLSSHLYPFTVTGGVTPGPQLHQALGYFVPTLMHDPSTDTFFFPEAGYGSNGVHVFDALTGDRLTEEIIATTGIPTDLALLCDFDCDGDARPELDDFFTFAGCMRGPGGGLELGCLCCDRDSSESVDLRDFAAFQRVFGGARRGGAK